MKLCILPVLLAAGIVLASVPAVVAQGTKQQTEAEDVSKRQDARPKGKVVEPGKCHTNGDGVKVCNTGSEGDMKVDPSAGTGNSATTVDCGNRVEGTVDGIDSNDTVNVSSKGDVTITGSGGTVNINGSGAQATITNNGPPGGGNITAHGPGGMTVTIPPGNTATVNT